MARNAELIKMALGYDPGLSRGALHDFIEFVKVKERRERLSRKRSGIKKEITNSISDTQPFQGPLQFDISPNGAIIFNTQE